MRPLLAQLRLRHVPLLNTRNEGFAPNGWRAGIGGVTNFGVYSNCIGVTCRQRWNEWMQVGKGVQIKDPLRALRYTAYETVSWRSTVQSNEWLHQRDKTTIPGNRLNHAELIENSSSQTQWKEWFREVPRCCCITTALLTTAAQEPHQQPHPIPSCNASGPSTSP